jgi:hypothetical protein
MHLIHHDVRKSIQCRRIRVEHVPKHFGGHHHDVGIAVDGLIAREQTDALGAIPGHQVVVFLVAQRLDGCGVEALSARRQREVHGEFADDRLACTGRCAHQHAMPVLQGLAGALLKVVQRKRQLRGEACELAARWRRHQL